MPPPAAEGVSRKLPEVRASNDGVSETLIDHLRKKVVRTEENRKHLKEAKSKTEQADKPKYKKQIGGAHSPTSDRELECVTYDHYGQPMPYQQVACERLPSLFSNKLVAKQPEYLAELVKAPSISKRKGSMAKKQSQKDAEQSQS